MDKEKTKTSLVERGQTELMNAAHEIIADYQESVDFLKKVYRAERKKIERGEDAGAAGIAAGRAVATCSTAMLHRITEVIKLVQGEDGEDNNEVIICAGTDKIKAASKPPAIEERPAVRVEDDKKVPM